MNNILTEDCINNILGHIKKCWNYDYPTGKTLETAVYRGLAPFYPDSKLLGSPTTFVDCGKEQHAFDMKGAKTLGHIIKPTKGANHDDNVFVEQDIPGKGKIYVRVPNSIMTQVRRPKVDLKNYTGDATVTLQEQINDYYEFAVSTSTKAGYTEMLSFVLLYGIDEKRGVKSVFLTIEEFHIPDVVEYRVGKSEATDDGTSVPNSYQGIDANGNVVFSLSSFNKGSSNLYKRFTTKQGRLMSWSMEQEDTTVYTREELEKTCVFKTI